MTRYASAAESKAAGLIDRLSEINLAGTINEVALGKLEREARQLMHTDAAGSHAVLGGVASLRWNVERVHDHYRIALQHLDTPPMHHNYSVALSNVEERESALTEAEIAYRRSPDGKFLLDHVIKKAVDSGHFADAGGYCARWAALAPGEEHPMAQQVSRLEDAVAARAFSESAVRQVVGMLCAVQANDKARSVQSTIIADPDDPHSFMYEQHVQASSDRAALLNGRFVDEVASDGELMKDPGLNFVAMFVGAEG